MVGPGIFMLIRVSETLVAEELRVNWNHILKYFVCNDEEILIMEITKEFFPAFDF